MIINYSNIFTKTKYCKGVQESKTEAATEVIRPDAERCAAGNVKQPPGLTKPTKSITNITDEIVNYYIKEKKFRVNFIKK